MREVSFREEEDWGGTDERPDVADSWLAAVAAHCPNLQSADLTRCKAVTDGGLASLAKCAQLASLNLAGCRQVTDGALASLA